MKYNEFLHRRTGNRYVYKWIVDNDSPSVFMLCDHCKAEAPLHVWRRGAAYCELCSNIAPSALMAEINLSLNNAMRIAGVFDEHNVEEVNMD